MLQETAYFTGEIMTKDCGNNRRIKVHRATGDMIKHSTFILKQEVYEYITCRLLIILLKDWHPIPIY
jgi:hypothetical protein